MQHVWERWDLWDGKSEQKIELGIPRRIWENNIKIYVVHINMVEGYICVLYQKFHKSIIKNYSYFLFLIALYCAYALCNNWKGSDQSNLFYLFLHFYIALYFNTKSVYICFSNNLYVFLLDDGRIRFKKNAVRKIIHNYKFILHACETVDITHIYIYIVYPTEDISRLQPYKMVEESSRD
jgi:hypothetical protein